jgi:PcfJ-like protein
MPDERDENEFSVLKPSLRPLAEAALRQLVEPVRARDGADGTLDIKRWNQEGVPSLEVHNWRRSHGSEAGLHIDRLEVAGGRADITLRGPADERGYGSTFRLHLRRSRPGTAVSLTKDRYDNWPSAEKSNELIANWLRRLESEAGRIRTEPAVSWNLSRLENPAAHYIERRDLRGGTVELSIDKERLEADWPPDRWHRNGYRYPSLRVRIHSDSRVVVHGDADLLRLNWGENPKPDIYSRLRASVLAQVIDLLPADLLQRTRGIHASLETYNLVQSSLGFRQLYDNAPLVAVQLAELARYGQLVDAYGSRSRRKRSYARVHAMVERPLRELVTAATIRRRRWRSSAPTHFPGDQTEFDQAAASLVAYVRHPLPELLELDTDHGVYADEGVYWGRRGALREEFVEFLKKANVDRVRELTDPKSWGLVRKAVATRAVLGHKVLENPSAALRAVQTYLPPNIYDLYEGDGGDVADDVLRQVDDYLRRDEQAEALLSDADENPALLPSFRKLCVASKLWHRELRHQQLDEAALEMANDTAEFTPSPLDGLVIERYRLRQLSTDSSLRREGSRMRHCVGSYGSRCVRGESIIFSVETMVGDGEWDGVATMELDKNHRIRQLYGPRDRRVKNEFRDLLQKAVNDNKPKKSYVSREQWQRTKSKQRSRPARGDLAA